jgi:hypothetical protein
LEPLHPPAFAWHLIPLELAHSLLPAGHLEVIYAH